MEEGVKSDKCRLMGIREILKVCHGPFLKEKRWRRLNRSALVKSLGSFSSPLQPIRVVWIRFKVHTVS